MKKNTFNKLMINFMFSVSIVFISQEPNLLFYFILFFYILCVWIKYIN